MYCYKHKDVATSLSCGRCERPICVRCSSHTDVGVRCKECAPSGMRPKRVGMTGGTVLGGAIILILVIVAATSVFDLSGAGDSDDYWDEYYDYEEFYGVATVTEVIDPWLPDDESIRPSDGSRFIAVNVTIENDGSMPDVPVYVGSYGFAAADGENYVYQPREHQLNPSLPDGLTLEAGQKARGWVVFEVPEGTEIESLSYFTSTVSLSPAEGP